MTTLYAETKLEDRWKSIRKVGKIKEQQLLTRLIGTLFVLVVGIFIGANWFGNENYNSSIYTELLSILVTVGILDTLNRYRTGQQNERITQDQLIQQVGSHDHVTASIAIRHLRGRGWLTGDKGILQGANLFRADLKGADLWGANLKNCVLDNANLQGINFRQVDLTQADLRRTNLNDARLEGANLAGASLDSAFLRNAGLLRANLRNSNLTATVFEEAHLWQADLRGAYMMYANLDGVRFKNTLFDENTTLPDGKKWTRMTDMQYYGAIVEDEDITR